MIRTALTALGADWLDVLAIAAIVVGLVVYWWSRKATKHPEYAARVEASVIDPALRRAGLDRLADEDLVIRGQALYDQSSKLADDLEGQAARLMAHAKVLRKKLDPGS